MSGQNPNPTYQASQGYGASQQDHRMGASHTANYGGQIPLSLLPALIYSPKWKALYLAYRFSGADELQEAEHCLGVLIRPSPPPRPHDCGVRCNITRLK